MLSFFFALLFFSAASSLKIWIPNTDINNKLNWDIKDTPKECDNIRFRGQSEVAAYWNLQIVIITGLSLPQTGDVIFPHSINIRFRDKEKCSQGRDLKYIRDGMKGWLDPDNWKSDSESQWLPHSERVPCAGESILFPPERTFAVQLPNVLIPIGEISFDNDVFRGSTWTQFLSTELGFQLFRGPESLRNIPWRDDEGCSNNKKCFCSRSPYSIRDGLYRETNPRIFQEAVCLYAMPKCPPSACYSPVVPEGHCCGICGAVIKIQDNTEEGLNISSLKAKVQTELGEYDPEEKLKTYVGRTIDENIQIVVVSENPEDTIKSHGFSNLIRKKLTDHKLQGRISSLNSGLKFSNYLFNSISGAVFGTLVAVLLLFMSIYYIYLILPKKKLQSSVTGNPFMFARFENIVNEENLEIGVEAEVPQELPKAFDNPMYSGSAESEKECKRTNTTNLQLKGNEISEGSITKEYTNPIYSELEETTKASEFFEVVKGEKEEFSEVNL